MSKLEVYPHRNPYPDWNNVDPERRPVPRRPASHRGMVIALVVIAD